MKFTFWFDSIVPRMFGANAITLYPFVFFSYDAKTHYENHEVGHEMIHCYQIKDAGILGFYFNYLKQWWQNGRDYWSIPYEKTAYNLQSQVAVPHEIIEQCIAQKKFISFKTAEVCPLQYGGGEMA